MSTEISRNAMNQARARALGLLLTVSLAGAAALISGQGPQSPFISRASDGHRVHILKPPPRIPGPFSPRPMNASPLNQALVYDDWDGTGLLVDHGGPEMGNASVQMIYWNSSASDSTQTSMGYPTIKAQIDAFVTAFGNGVNWLDSVNDDYTIVQQYGTSNSIAPTLGNLGFLLDTQPTVATIDDTAIRTYLAGLFNADRLTASANVIYGIVFPPGMQVTVGGDASCSVFCAYHSSFVYRGQAIKYAIYPYLNTACSRCSLEGKSVADMLTIVISHETREAVTDPKFDAWYDAAGFEADDKCAWRHLYQMNNGGFWVQPEFSNGGTVTASGFTATYPGPGCVVPAAPAPPAIVTQPQSQAILSGQSAQLTVVASGTEPLSYQWYVGSSGVTSNPIADATGSSYLTPALTSTASFWVRVSNLYGTADSTTAVITIVLPAPFGKTDPLNAAVTVAATVTLRWGKSDGATSFEYCVDSTNNGACDAAWIAVGTTQSASVSGLNAGGIYFWQVRARNGSGAAEADGGSWWSFRIQASGDTLRYDLNHDGKPDLIWQQDRTHEVAVWYMGGSKGTDILGANWLNASDLSDWRVVAVADLNSDGCPDLVWQHESTRQVTVWFMGGTEGSDFLGSASLSSKTIADWHVAALSDFDGDGHPDLVWQHDTTGQATVWYLGGSDGTAFLGSAVFNGSVLTGWRVVAAADLNADGRPDLIWQHDTTRQVMAWYMGGAGGDQFLSEAWLSSQETPDWRIMAVADFDGDGRQDLVWQNDTTRQVLVWYMGGGMGDMHIDSAWLNSTKLLDWRLIGW